ncbi:uncharacterized protein RSE6_10650 [Rhynchosporium secalis]|uniref:Uncharacterized protein n=1 Tax=Rhynchosporium secalis TaxID=38038 RepID=A0A1E1MKZ8_RHYSE|nr:uncharacterized protein RSE6_10650 [Rhynchosporium secalis]
MAGIPVYTSSPMKASKPSATTPQTDAPGSQGEHIAPNAAPTTATASATSSYMPAQPTSVTFPAPTTAAQQRYAPLQPTATTKIDSQPPAPQPGAVPTPSSRSAIPPPPKAGESYQPQQTAAPVQSYPPQMSYPPAATYGSIPPSSTTSTTNAPSILFPVALPTAESAPRSSLEHPPGYHQNVYASELTSDQRRAQETEQANDSSVLGLSNQDKGSTGGFDSEGVWDTAKKWAQTAGEKISVAEAEVWKKINNE